MISNKTAATLLFITLAMKADASSSGGVQEPSSSGMSVLNKKRGRVSLMGKNVKRLMDTSSAENPVGAIVESTRKMNISQEQPVPRVNKEFEELIKQERYNDIIKLALKLKMKTGEFMKRLSPIVKTLEQYKGFVKYFKRHKMVAKFYLYGDVGVIKAALVESGVYDNQSYAGGGDLETALILAFKEDHHDRIIELLKIRQEVTAEGDKQDKQSGLQASFESFVGFFLPDLAPEMDDMPLRRFLVSHEEELSEKHPDILDIICQKLIDHLRLKFNEPGAKKLLVDIIGQPLLLTSATFANGFLGYSSKPPGSIKPRWGDVLREGLKNARASEVERLWQTEERVHRAPDMTLSNFNRSAPPKRAHMTRFNFINCAWGGVILEGLTSGPLSDRERLWLTMTIVRPTQFSGPFPSTTDALAHVVRQFPTKQELERDWHKGKVAILFDSIKGLESIIILPDVLWSIVFEYLISLTFTEDPIEIEPRTLESAELSFEDLEKILIIQQFLDTTNLQESAKAKDLQRFLETMD